MLDSYKEYCPYCAEPIELLVDYSMGAHRYIEDCQVCCRPITVVVSAVDELNGNDTVIFLYREDETG